MSYQDEEDTYKGQLHKRLREIDIITHKVNTIEHSVSEIKSDIKQINETLLDPESGLAIKINTLKGKADSYDRVVGIAEKVMIGLLSSGLGAMIVFFIGQ